MLTAAFAGEFTSWPLMKKMTRAGAAALRSAEQLNTLGALAGQPSAQTALNSGGIAALRRASAEAQHHDAVDGTSPARVTRMWEDHLQHGGQTAAPTVNAAAATFLSDANWTSNPLSSLAALRRGVPITLAVHNPLPWPATRVVSMAVPVAVRVVDSNCTKVPSDIFPQALPNDSWPRGPGGAAQTSQSASTPPAGDSELVFIAEGLPPLGFRRYTIHPVTGIDFGNSIVHGSPVADDDPISITNGAFALGLTHSFCDKWRSLAIAAVNSCMVRIELCTFVRT